MVSQSRLLTWRFHQVSQLIVESFAYLRQGTGDPFLG